MKIVSDLSRSVLVTEDKQGEVGMSPLAACLRLTPSERWPGAKGPPDMTEDDSISEEEELPVAR